MASAAVRMTDAEKAPIAWIKGMNGNVVGWVARKEYSKFCMGGGLSRDTRQRCLWRNGNDSLVRDLVLVQEL